MFGLALLFIKWILIIVFVIGAIAALWFTIRNILEAAKERKALKEHEERLAALEDLNDGLE